MQELKFRCWDSKIMRTDFALNADGDNSDLEYSDDFDVVTKGIVMQFTGLHDKNGKEIYEGDIIRIPEFEDNGDDKITEIKFEFNSFRGWYGLPNTEIIGNVYENPELLEIN